MVDPIKIQLRPGINRETTDYGNTGGWYDCNLARVKTGTWNSMGGWQKFTAEPVLGTMRSLFPWSTLNGSRWYATGTNLKYYILRGNLPVDITPIRRTVTLANDPFAIVNGQSTMTVTDVANGAVLNDFVTFSGATTIGGNVTDTILNAEFQITSIVSDDVYTVTLPVVSDTTDAAGGGAAVEAEYQINVGLDTTALGNGWGTGPYGSGGWGEGSSIFVETDQLRLWSEDNFGEDLLFCVRNGGIYYKDMSGPVTDRGVNITTLGNGPSIAAQVLVSDNSRHVLAYGCNPVDSAIRDPRLVRWSPSENIAQWPPATTNTAGSLRFAGLSGEDTGLRIQCFHFQTQAFVLGLKLFVRSGARFTGSAHGIQLLSTGFKGRSCLSRSKLCAPQCGFIAFQLALCSGGGRSRILRDCDIPGQRIGSLIVQNEP